MGLVEHDDESPPRAPDPTPPGTPPWQRWQVGERVVVRYRLSPDGHTDGAGRPRFSDALGDLVEVRKDGVVVRTRRGDVEVLASTMVTGKRVPPPPDRSRYRREPPA